jgi:hypothetical protein
LHISGFTPTDLNKAFTGRKINIIDVKEHFLFCLKIKVVAQQFFASVFDFGSIMMSKDKKAEKDYFRYSQICVRPPLGPQKSGR